MKAKFELTEQNYQYLFENASDAIWVRDLEGNFIIANKASAALCHCTSGNPIFEPMIPFLVTKIISQFAVWLPQRSRVSIISSLS